MEVRPLFLKLCVHLSMLFPFFRFLYMLILAMDANFRLRNRMSSTDAADPALGPGWAYFVKDEPYKEHLKNYVSEADVSAHALLSTISLIRKQISTCIAFQALLQKDSKMTTGLRSSGVGACVCARHELIRPQGIGDLQKGER